MHGRPHPWLFLLAVCVLGGGLMAGDMGVMLVGMLGAAWTLGML